MAVVRLSHIVITIIVVLCFLAGVSFAEAKKPNVVIIRKGKALPEKPARRISGRDLGRQVGTALVGDVQ